MTDEKAWFRSRTVWASVATVLLAAASLAGVPAEAGDAAEIAEHLTQLATAACGLVAVLGRLKARSRLR